MKIIHVLTPDGSPGIIALSENLIHAEHLGKCEPVFAGFCNADFSHPRGHSSTLTGATRGAHESDESTIKALMGITLH
jgi:hypothetical protein